MTHPYPIHGVAYATTGTPVIKVKLFNRSGELIFSTTSDEMGRPAAVSEAAMFAAALQDVVQTSVEAGLAVTHHPFHLAVGRVPDGVVEFHADVSEVSARLSADLRCDAERVIGTMLALYLAVILVIGWGTRILTSTQELAARQGRGLAAIDQVFRDGIESMVDGFLMLDADWRVIPGTSATSRSSRIFKAS